MDTLAHRALARRTALGLSQAEVARLSGVSQQAIAQIEDGTTKRPRVLLELSRALKTTPDWLRFGEDGPAAPEPTPPEPTPPEPPPPEPSAPARRPRPRPDPAAEGQRLEPIAVPYAADMPKSVPVFGTVVGGSQGDFHWNGEVVDHVRRPPGIADARRVFALYVNGTSMEPRYRPGDLVYVNPARAPRAGDDVIVELHDDGVDGAGPAYVKTLVARTPTLLICEQYNPRRRVEYSLGAVRQVLRIIPYAELLGV